MGQFLVLALGTGWLCAAPGFTRSNTPSPPYWGDHHLTETQSFHPSWRFSSKTQWPLWLCFCSLLWHPLLALIKMYLRSDAHALHSGMCSKHSILIRYPEFSYFQKSDFFPTILVYHWDWKSIFTIWKWNSPLRKINEKEVVWTLVSRASAAWSITIGVVRCEGWLWQLLCSFFFFHMKQLPWNYHPIYGYTLVENAGFVSLKHSPPMILPPILSDMTT